MNNHVLTESGNSSRKGLVHVYTGEGKGKTTAALGLALRATGQGMRVCVLQFMKGSKLCGEHRFIGRWPAFDILQPSPASYFSQSADERKLMADRVIVLALETVKSEIYDLVILDEVVTALRNGLVSEEDVLGLIATRAPGVELVLTGRGATPALIAAADLVTEMVAIKHPFGKGIRARRGIEY